MNSKVRRAELPPVTTGELSEAQIDEIKHAAKVLAFYVELELTYVQLDLDNPGWLDNKLRGSLNMVIRRLAKSGVVKTDIHGRVRIFKSLIWARYPVRRYMYTFDLD